MELTQKKYLYPGSKTTFYTVSWVRSIEHTNKDIQKWCKKTFGKPGYNEKLEMVRWTDNISESNTITFLQESDFMMFLLRWQ